ncbi:hypothetical protein [Actinoplanes subglobosus]|uniref:Uncharacterized protein n=1 Tax=Actinoplanes subglobosus TaxID=1547892 RepID=A0ABV8IWV5_9ACTN
MGRPETPIPQGRPMRAMANHLRHLRQTAGAPSYRTLSRHVHVEQQSLSQTANGTRVGWGRVLLYVQALRIHDEAAVSYADLATLKELWQLGEQQYQTMATRALRRRQSHDAFWDEIDNPVGRMPPADSWTLTPGITDVTRLATLRTTIGLYTLLLEITARRGIDLAAPRRSRPAAPAFSWFGPSSPAPTVPVVPRIRDATDITPDALALAVQACGGTDGDRAAWLATLQRINRDADHGPPRLPTDPAARSHLGRDRHRLTQLAGTVMRRPDARGLLPT